MLVSLSMNNFGLFKKVNMDFDDHFNVITGESGTGKSMLLNAINVFLTGNIPQNLKTNEGSVSAFFLINEFLKEIIKEHVPIKDDELILSVNYTPKKVLFRINDTIVSKNIVQEISKFLIEMHSQDSNIALRDENYQSTLILRILRENFLQYFSKYDEKFQEYMKLKKRYDNLPSNTTEIFRNIDILNYQIKEIEEVNLNPNEDDDLSERFRTLNNIEEIKERIIESLNILKDSEDQSIDVALGKIIFNLSKIINFGFKEEYSLAIDIQDQFNQLYSILENRFNELEVDPEELNKVALRLNKIMELKRKYGPTLQDVLDTLTKLRKEKNELEEIQRDLYELEPALIKIKNELEIESCNIIEKSKPFLQDIKEKVEGNLKDLNMENCKIDFKIEQLKEPRKESFHKITLLLKTNPKSEFLPLSDIASGGELSRIILALEAVIGNNHNIDTMFFDEIDSGVGPRMADIVGSKLKELSSKKQIIVITHMPQVANLAKKHFKITKSLENNETVSKIIELNDEERQEEIKEMYGNIVYIEG
ncbi:DNA repair protein RecN [Petrotoga sp. 9PWA.NaAc.5.4]|uniref:DNA repair protein RecN n=1 Tax=Petrotoga sp. 9PWA.NaAc.5.4 TaxID=1434328 RepID=UPI000CC499C0|nr:AAA family ATPase [Petrotoga sp. 9PWA.NaAc.5.4]PNR95802.1 hypothetical protein X924_03805 [Petrotoga sp. 9PWA.NaAc.5.4]